MSEIYKLSVAELESVNNLLIKRTGISDSSLCFCGNERNFSDCCKLKPNFWISNQYVDQLIGFIKSKNWHVDDVPLLFGSNNFEDYYSRSHDSCAQPTCKKKLLTHMFTGKSMLKNTSIITAAKYTTIVAMAMVALRRLASRNQ